MELGIALALGFLSGVIFGVLVAAWATWIIVKRYRKSQEQQVAEFLRAFAEAAGKAPEPEQAGVN